MWRWGWLTAWLLILLCMVFVAGAQQTAHPTQVEKGFAWLRAQVQPDGTIAGENASQALPVQVRTETLHSLALFDSRPEGLIGRIEDEAQSHTELQARKALAMRLANRDAARVIADLGLQQNADGGFGSNRLYHSNALDTAYALIALSAVVDADSAKVTAALTYLRLSRQSLSGWPIGDHASVYATSAVLLAAQSWSTRAQSGDIVAAAREWLLTQRDAGGAYGNVMDNANALLALTTQTSDETVLTPLSDALKQSQLDTGSWDNDPYITALALRALYRATIGLPPTTTGAITGTVVAEEGGVVVQGATVAVRDAPQTQVATAADGGFMLLSLSPGQHTVDIQALGYATASFSVAVTAGNTTNTGVIRLKKSSLSAEIFGVVRASTGEALANVLVASGTASTYTSANGSYSLPGLSPGISTVSFTINYQGLRPLEMTVSLESGHRYQLSPTLFPNSQTIPSTATIRGLIVDQADGQPLAGASVRVGTVNAITAANGGFEIPQLAISGYAVTIRADGYFDRQGEVGLAAGINDVGRIALTRVPQTSTLTGVATDAETGNPIPGAIFVVQGQTATAAAGPDGRYLLSGIQGTEFTLIVSGQGYSTRSLSVSLPAIGQSTLDVELLPIGDSTIVFESVTANRTIYGPSGEVELEVEVRNGGASAADLVIDAEVRNPDGDVVFVFKGNAKGLGLDPPNLPLRFEAGTLTEIELDWVLVRQPAGVYTVLARARDTQGRVRAEGSTRFAIDSLPMLGGAVIADPPLAQIDSGTPIRITAELTNLGNQPIPAGNAELKIVLEATDPALVGQPRSTVETVAIFENQQMQHLQRDAAGNFYTTQDSRRINRIAPNGTLTVLADLPGYVGDLAVQSDGTAWTCLAGTLHRVSPTGVVTRFTLPSVTSCSIDVNDAGEVLVGGTSLQGSHYAQTLIRVKPGVSQELLWANGLSQPVGLTRLANGGYAVTNSSDGTVSLISETGAITPLANGLSSPADLVELANGDLVVADSRANTLVRVTRAGVRSTFASGPLLNQPYGLALRGDGSLLVSNQGNNSIVLASASGAVTPYMQGGMQTPVSLASDPDGSLVVANAGDGSLSRIRDGKVGTIATGLGVLTALVSDSQGVKYAATLAGDIRKVTPGGQVTTIASNLGRITSLALQGDETLYAAEETRNRIVGLRLATGEQFRIDSPFNYVSNVMPGAGGRLYLVSTGFVSVREADGSFRRLLDNAPTRLAAMPEGGLVFWRNNSDLVTLSDSGVVTSARNAPYHLYGLAARGSGKVALLKYTNRYEIDEYDLATGSLTTVAVLGTTAPSDFGSDLQGNIVYQLGPEFHQIGTDNLDRRYLFAVPSESVNSYSVAADGKLLLRTSQQNLYEADFQTGTTRRLLSGLPHSGGVTRTSTGVLVATAISENTLMLYAQDGTIAERIDSFSVPRSLAWAGNSLRMVDQSYKLLEIPTAGGSPRKLAYPFYATLITHDSALNTTYGAGHSAGLLEWRSSGVVSHTVDYDGNGLNAFHAMGNGRFAYAQAGNNLVAMAQMGQTTVRFGGLSAPSGLSLADDGSLLVANTQGNTVLRFRRPDSAGELIYTGSSPRFVHADEDGGFWVTSNAGLQKIGSDGSIVAMPYTLAGNPQMAAYDLDVKNGIATVVDYRHGIIRTLAGGEATVLAGALSVVESVAWSPDGAPSVLDRDNKTVFEIRDGSMIKRMDRAYLAEHIAYAGDGTLYTAGRSAELNRLANGLQHRLVVGGFIRDPNFTGVVGVSETEVYVLGYGYHNELQRYRSAIYKVTAERKTAPPPTGQMVYTASVPISEIAAVPDTRVLNFGEWRPPYAGDFRLEVTVPGTEGRLVNFVHVGAGVDAALSVEPDAFPPGDRTAKMRLELSGGDFTSLSRAEFTRFRRFEDVGWPIGMAADRDGNIYVLSLYGGLFKIPPAARWSQLLSGLDARFGLAIDDNEILYFLRKSATGRYDLVKYNTRDGRLDVHAKLDALDASGVVIDSRANAYVGMPNRLVRIAPDGTISTVTTIGFPSPRGLAIDGKDNIYVQNDNHLVTQVMPDGRTYPIFSRGDVVNDPIFEGDRLPTIAGDCSDNLYVATSQWAKVGQSGEEHTLTQIISRTGEVGLVMDTSRTNPMLTDIDFLAYDRFGQRLLLMDDGAGNHSIPVTCGAIDVETHLFSYPGQSLSGFNLPPNASIPHPDGRTEYVWNLRDVTASGMSIDFAAPLKSLVLGETRQTIDSGHLVFKNSFTAGVYRLPLSIPKVTVDNLAEIAVTTDKPEYRANETVAIGLGLRNPGQSVIAGDLVVDILDAYGTVVDEAHRAPVSIPALTTFPVSDTYGVGTILPAGYTIRARLFDQDREMARSTAPFTVLPANLETAAQGALTLSRTVFEPTDRVSIVSAAHNQSVNVNLGGLMLMVRVYAPSGDLVFTAGHAVDTLLHGVHRSYTADFTMDRLAPGTYRVRQTLSDSFGREYDVDEAEYRVLSTAETGFGLRGTISADPQTVPIGTPIALSAAAFNDGNAALASGQFVVRVLDLVHGTELHRWRIDADVAAGAAQHMGLDWETLVYAPGDYVATLALVIGQSERVLASTGLTLVRPQNQVRIGLRQALGTEGKLLLLASCAPGEAPECADGRKAEAERLLAALGIAHIATTDHDNFKRLMRSGDFDAYWISGGSLKLDPTLAEELIEANVRGDGLIVDGVHDARNSRLHAAMGVKFQGKLPLRDFEVAMSDTPVFDPVQFDIRDKVVRFLSETASVQGRFNNGDAAVLIHESGRGHAVSFAFDFVGTIRASTSQSAMREVLRRSIVYAMPATADEIVAGQSFSVLTYVNSRLGTLQTWQPLSFSDSLEALGVEPDLAKAAGHDGGWRFDLDSDQRRRLDLLTGIDRKDDAPIAMADNATDRPGTNGLSDFSSGLSQSRAKSISAGSAMNTTRAWLRLRLPAVATLLRTEPESAVRDGLSIAWRFDLDLDHERRFTTWLRAPDQDGDLTIMVAAGAGDEIGDSEHAQSSITVTVVSSGRLASDLVAGIGAIKPTRAHEIQALRRVVEDIDMAKGKIAAGEHELAIQALLRARDSLLKVTTVDVSDARLALSRYLAFAERKSAQP